MESDMCVDRVKWGKRVRTGFLSPSVSSSVYGFVLRGCKTKWAIKMYSFQLFLLNSYFINSPHFLEIASPKSPISLSSFLSFFPIHIFYRSTRPRSQSLNLFFPTSLCPSPLSYNNSNKSQEDMLCHRDKQGCRFVQRANTECAKIALLWLQ